AQADGGQFLAAFWVTVMEMVWTVGITWLCGLVIGLMMGSIPILRESFTPLLDAAFAIPWVVLYPLVVSWFGLDSPSKVAYGVILGILPVILNTMSGMKSIDSRYLLLARSLSASRLDTLVKIAVPLALPSIVSGLRIGAGLSIIGVIVGEMFTSTRGIGYLISYYRTLLDTGHVFLGMFLALMVACLSNLGLSYMEKKFKRYANG
ncbi:MAG: ABC transporter permease subunit, partial [Alicyclobacillus sp.]|nr:ABC transporter permease subunit [Alicyclobacillus sp.]